MNREKRTYPGKLLDVDYYPVFSDGRRIPSKAPKTKRSTAEQEKYNHNKAVREFVRIVNANFDDHDYLSNPTGSPGLPQQDRDDEKRISTNVLARLRRKRKS